MIQLLLRPFRPLPQPFKAPRPHSPLAEVLQADCRWDGSPLQQGLHPQGPCHQEHPSGCSTQLQGVCSTAAAAAQWTAPAGCYDLTFDPYDVVICLAVAYHLHLLLHYHIHDCHSLDSTFPPRLQTLACLVTSPMSTTGRKVGVSLSSGLPLRLSSTASTPLAVTCGAMGWSCLRYGHWDASPLGKRPPDRWVDLTALNVGTIKCRNKHHASLSVSCCIYTGFLMMSSQWQ